ncbi:hypothetical protein MSG28_002499 [Choristoneura fumiferana]|uniref:Uncharacterized protein n=1 Tax=Choristoneura fumiferana TaxID=7141 RepID=A0ACC0JW51_CHOFU|nr:hypothetical protein MSG28_002499 [Choristoneura fumiferana]
MEAVPKLPLISFKLKTSAEGTHFGPKLKQYIADAYKEDPESYSNEIHQLESLRSAAVRPSSDEAGLSSLYRYFCQLRAIQSRFPMGKGQPAACTYSWKDLYANMTCPLADIRFEMACILYNIGALHTQLGAAEPRTSAESLKAACTHFQNAAWAFQVVREQYPQPTGVDISTEIVMLLQEICFAQAQECILDKSIQDTRKPSVIGSVATQVMFFYRNSLAHLGPSAGTDNIHEIVYTKRYNQWHRYLTFKLHYIGCIVCLYQGMHAEEQQKMGERVAFYQQAADKLAEAQKLAKYIEPVQVTEEALTFTNDVVEGKRKAAKNENEFIYHEEVPDKDLLADMKPVCLVKALAINFDDPQISGPDVFSRLIPIGAHEASSVYSEEKAKLLRQVTSQVDAKNTELIEFMSSLQLDQLEVLDSDQKIPQEIVDRCAAMNAKTEIIQTLVDSMNNLAEIISDVEGSLAEIKALIQEETLKEKEYQKVMGPRPPSIVQTELSREYHKYQEAHARTNESNQVLHKAMTLHIANLRQLALPLDVLQSRIPTIDNIEGLDREAMSEMRRVVGKAREMQTQRDSLVAALRAAVAADDVTARLLARGSEPRDQLFARELAKHESQVKIIETNLAAQENIINRLTSLYASYGESRRMLSELLRKREGTINALITSYDTYGELLGKCQKGLEFYKKLSHNVGQLLTRLRGTCQVQSEERESMLAKQTKAATPVPASPAKSDGAEPRVEGSGLKLKDYLPYMKKRILPKTPAAQMEAMPQDTYYPESIYPTGVRPAPVGSEADPTQMQLPDGVVMPQMQNMQNPNPYVRYGSPYAQSEIEAYPLPSNLSYNAKAYEKPEENPYGYSVYTPPQYSHQMSNPQSYANPYYSATQDNATVVTGSQSAAAYNLQSSQANAPNMNLNQNIPTASHMNPSVPSSVSQPNQYNPYDMYGHSQIAPIPEVPSTVSAYSAANQTDLSANFAQMQVSGPKETPYQPASYSDYSQTYYSVNYPQAATPNNATYSHAGQDSNTHSVQTPTEYNVLNYPYSTESVAVQYAQPPISSVSTAYPEQQYSYTSAYENSSQGYTIYTNAETMAYSTTTVSNASVDSSYMPPDQNPALSQIDAYDQPIKSHVTGEALTNYPGYQSYEPTSYAPAQSNPPETAPATSTYYQDPTNINYALTYQNHPGYNYNTATGSYDYNYGSQNAYTSYAGQSTADPQSVSKDPNWNPPTVYTSAGACDTVQSPSETPQVPSQPSDTQAYYNTPYGYVTNSNQPNQVVNNPEATATNYGADVNQSTYMQSGQSEYTSVSQTNNQVSSPKEEIQQPTFEPKPESKQVPPAQETERKLPEEPEPIKVETPEQKPEPSVFDLLSDIDFSVEQKPLMPEIKVPQISESAIKKPLPMPKVEPIVRPVLKEEIIQRPAKRDLFSDPSLLNSFTQEVKSLQTLVDSLTNRTSSGLTLLDSKWKTFQDVQMQGKSHWPTAMGQCLELPGGPKVVLDEVTCTVHWTERKLTVTDNKTVHKVSHYQINVFPAK